MFLAMADIPVRQTHIAVGHRSKPHAGAVLDDGVTGAVQVYVNILAFVDPHLPSSHNDNTACYSRHVSRPCYVSGNDEALVDILHSEPSKRSASGGRGSRHVDDAPLEISQAAVRSRPRRRRWKDDVQPSVPRYRDVSGGGKAGLSDFGTRLGHLLVVVLGQ